MTDDDSRAHTADRLVSYLSCSVERVGEPLHDDAGKGRRGTDSAVEARGETR